MDYLLCTHRRFEATAAAAPLIMADELLEFWGAIYLDNPVIAQLGISFEAFLAQPARILPAASFTALVPLTEFFDRLPLLPAQRAVRDRLDAADAGQMELALGVSEARLTAASPTIRDGALVEKLRHHIWPRHQDRRAVREFAEEATS